MAELADAADSKSAGTWYLAGSIPVPGTTFISSHLNLSALKSAGITPSAACGVLRGVPLVTGLMADG